MSKSNQITIDPTTVVEEMTEDAIVKRAESLVAETVKSKLDLTKELISKIGLEYMALKVKDVKDVETHKKVVEARKRVKKMRTGVDGVAKALKKDALLYQRTVNATAQELVDLLRPIENHLTEQEQFIEKEKQRLIQEALEKEENLKKQRIERVLAAGAKFDGISSYVAGKVNMPLDQIISLSELAFEKLELSIQAEAKIEAEAEKKKQDEIERQRIENEELRKKVAAYEEAEKKKQEAIDKPAEAEIKVVAGAKIKPDPEPTPSNEPPPGADIIPLNPANTEKPAQDFSHVEALAEIQLQRTNYTESQNAVLAELESKIRQAVAIAIMKLSDDF